MCDLIKELNTLHSFLLVICILCSVSTSYRDNVVSVHVLIKAQMRTEEEREAKTCKSGTNTGTDTSARCVCVCLCVHTHSENGDVDRTEVIGDGRIFI